MEGEEDSGQKDESGRGKIQIVCNVAEMVKRGEISKGRTGFFQIILTYQEGKN